jgi:hypothetical protein
MDVAKVDPGTAHRPVGGGAVDPARAGALPSRGRRARRVLGVSVALVAAFAGVLAMLPTLLGVPAVRAELERQVSRVTSTTVRWESLQVGLLPAPYGLIRRASIDLPGRLQAHADEVRIDLDLRALLSRRLEVTGIRLARPVLHATVPAFATDPDGPVDPMAAYRRVAAPLAAALERIGPGAVIVVDDADLTVDLTALPWTLAMTLSARGTLDADGATIEASATGAALGDARATARLGYADLGARVTLHASGMKPQPLLDRIAPAGGPGLEAARLDLRIDASADAAGTLSAKVAADAPTLAVTRRGARVEASPASLDAGVSWQAGLLALRVERVRIGDLVPEGRGGLERRPGDASATLTAEVPALDLARVRDAALALLDGDAPLRAQVARVRGGTATGLSVSVGGIGGPGGFDPGRVAARLRLHDGRIGLPEAGLTVTGVDGRLEWSGGSLRGHGIGARAGGSRIDAGAFAYRFADGRTSVSAPFDADLAELLAAVRRALPRERAAALDPIEGVLGRAWGRVAGALAGRSWSADTTIARSDALIRVRGLPWPVALREGRVSARPGRVDVAGVAGGVGASLFRDAGATLRLAGPLHVEDARGSARVALAEAVGWLRTQPALAPTLADIGAVQGSVEASLTGLSVDPRRIAQARYDLALVPNGVDVALRGLPGTLSVEGGVLRLAPQALRFQDVAVSMLDARGHVSGTVTGGAGRDPAVYASVAQGSLGAGMLAWAWARAGLPDRLEPRAPVSFDVSGARWSEGAGLDLQGDARIEAGPVLRADLTWRPGDLDVRSLRVQDAATDATVALRIRGPRIDAGFSGALDGGSIGRAFPHAGTERSDRVEGSFRGTIDRDRPRDATAVGRLAVRDVDLEWLAALPLRIERGTVESDGARIRVPAATVWLGDQSAELAGELVPGAGGPVIDADLETRGIAVEALMAALGGPGETPSTPPAPGSRNLPRSVPTWHLPVSGTLRLRAGFVEYGRYRVEPVVAALTVDPTRIVITATQASLCGIALPFSVELSADRVVASLRPQAVGQEITGTARCLTDGSVLLTGTYDLDADLHAQGRPEDLLASLRGRVDAEARAGTVERFALLGNILSVRGIGTTMSGLASGQRATGFDYRRMAVGGDIEGGVLRLDEGVFDSAGVGMAATGEIDLRDRSTRMTVLVAPFSQLDRLARRIPVIGYVLGGTLTSLPVQVTGDIRNPRVVPLGPEALSAELRGVFQRALRMPGKALRALEAPEAASPFPRGLDGGAPPR